MKRILLLLILLLSVSINSYDIEFETATSNICNSINGEFTISNLDVNNTQFKIIHNVANLELDFDLEVSGNKTIKYKYKPNCLLTGKKTIPIAIQHMDKAKLIHLPIEIKKSSNEVLEVMSEKLSDKQSLVTFCENQELEFELLNKNDYNIFYKIRIDGTYLDDDENGLNDTNEDEEDNEEDDSDDGEVEFLFNEWNTIKIDSKESYEFDVDLDYNNTSDFKLFYYNFLTKENREFQFYLNKSVNCTDDIIITPTHRFEMNWGLLIFFIIAVIVISFISFIWSYITREREMVLVLSNTKRLIKLKPEVKVEVKSSTKVVKKAVKKSSAKKTKKATKKTNTRSLKK